MSQVGDEEEERTINFIEEGESSFLMNRMEDEPGLKKQSKFISSFEGTLYFKGDRIIPEKEERDRIIEIAHRSHQGEGRTVSRICQFYWWPLINAQVRNYVKNCAICRLSDRTTVLREPSLSIEDYPLGPWERLGLDLAGPFSHGECKFLLVVQDYFSKYPFVIDMEDIGAEEIITEVEEIFNEVEYPKRIMTDNGRQFVAKKVGDYLKEKNIEHKTSQNYSPSSN